MASTSSLNIKLVQVITRYIELSKHQCIVNLGEKGATTFSENSSYSIESPYSDIFQNPYVGKVIAVLT